jgi:glutathione peroxidase
MLAKVDVNGDEACELFKELTSTSEPAGPVKWNFEKFLVGKDGKIVGRYRSGIKPESDDLTKAIEAELAK